MCKPRVRYFPAAALGAKMFQVENGEKDSVRFSVNGQGVHLAARMKVKRQRQWNTINKRVFII